MKRTEYPRPNLVRDQWMNLNGDWNFGFDDQDLGLINHWYNEGQSKLSQTIQVPFVFQSEESGINDRSVHNVVWYHKSLDYQASQGKHTILHFGAVDYQAMVFVNGQLAISHEGGNTPFQVDITPLLNEEKSQNIVVRVKDENSDEEMPRGKQFWEAESRSIWYTNSTGIWQTVWLEEVAPTYLASVKHHIAYDQGKVTMEVVIDGPISPLLELDYQVFYEE